MEVIVYADDIAIIIKVNTRIEIENLGNSVVQRLQKWYTTYKLKMLKKKTQAMLTKGKLHRETMPRIKVYKCEIYRQL